MGSCKDIDVHIRVVKEHSYHWHDHLTIVMVLTGEVKLRMWARDNVMKEGDFIVVGPNHLHNLTALTVDNLVVIISISREFCIEVRKDFLELLIICNSVQYGNKKLEMYKKIQRMLHGLINEHGKTTTNLKLKESAIQLIEYLCNEFDYIVVGDSEHKFSTYIVTRNKMIYKNFFLDNCEWSGLSLKAVAKVLDVNYTYLRTDILERFGFGFNWLKHTMMIEKAAKLMLSTDLRLIDISNLCGFSDQKYFRKYTKIFYECTPSEFRAKYKKNTNQENFVDIPIRHIVKMSETFW